MDCLHGVYYRLADKHVPHKMVHPVSRLKPPWVQYKSVGKASKETGSIMLREYLVIICVMKECRGCVQVTYNLTILWCDWNRHLLVTCSHFSLTATPIGQCSYVTVLFLFIEDAVMELSDPDSKVHGTNMGPIWGRQDPGGLHVGPMNFAGDVQFWLKRWVLLCLYWSSRCLPWPFRNLNKLGDESSSVISK